MRAADYFEAALVDDTGITSDMKTLAVQLLGLVLASVFYASHLMARSLDCKDKRLTAGQDVVAVTVGQVEVSGNEMVAKSKKDNCVMNGGGGIRGMPVEEGEQLQEEEKPADE